MNAIASMKAMKPFLTRKTGWRAAAAAGIMTLLVSVVMGRESSQPPTVIAHAARSTAPAVPADAFSEIDLERLKRTRNAAGGADLFAPRSPAPVAVPEAVSAEPAPPPPSAPPLPFTYLGKLVDGDKTEVFIARGDEHYSAEQGRTIDGQYRIEKVTANAVTFVYLPLGIRQRLPVPAQQ